MDSGWLNLIAADKWYRWDQVLVSFSSEANIGAVFCCDFKTEPGNSLLFHKRRRFRGQLSCAAVEQQLTTHQCRAESDLTAMESTEEPDRRKSYTGLLPPSKEFPVLVEVNEDNITVCARRKRSVLFPDAYLNEVWWLVVQVRLSWSDVADKAKVKNKNLWRTWACFKVFFAKWETL